MILLTQHARGTPFDNSINGFVATETQSAIEEAKSAALGLAQWIVSINRNAIMINNNWFGRNELMSNSASYVFNRATRLISLSWTNTNEDCSFDLEFYKNGRETTKIYTYEVRLKTMGYIFGLSYDFVAGDYLDIKYIDQGQNASDMGLDIGMTAI